MGGKIRRSSNHDMGVSLSSHLQRHLLFSTSTAGKSDRILLPQSAEIKGQNDQSLLVADPKNVMFSSGKSFEKKNVLLDSVAKSQEESLVKLSSTASSQAFCDILPNLPKVPLAGVEVSANLQNEDDNQTLQLGFSNPGFSFTRMKPGVISTGNANSALQIISPTSSSIRVGAETPMVADLRVLVRSFIIYSGHLVIF